MEETTKDKPILEEKTAKEKLINEKYQDLELNDHDIALVSAIQDLTKSIEGLRLATIMRR